MTVVVLKARALRPPGASATLDLQAAGPKLLDERLHCPRAPAGDPLFHRSSLHRLLAGNDTPGVTAAGASPGWSGQARGTVSGGSDEPAPLRRTPPLFGAASQGVGPASNRDQAGRRPRRPARSDATHRSHGSDGQTVGRVSDDGPCRRSGLPTVAPPERRTVARGRTPGSASRLTGRPSRDRIRLVVTRARQRPAD